MKTLGSKIKEARLAKNISYEKIHKKTKIAIPVIQAIEKGQAAHLPKPHYRAFVRGIAKEVNLDGDALLRELDSRQRRFEEEGILPGTEKTKSGLKDFLLSHQKAIVFFATGLVCLMVIGVYVRYGKSLFVEPKLPPKDVQLTEYSIPDKNRLEIPFLLVATSLADSRLFIEMDAGNAEEVHLSRGQKITRQVDSVVVLHVQNPAHVTLSLNENELKPQTDTDKPIALVISSQGIVRQSASALFAKVQEESKDEKSASNFLIGRVSPKQLFERLPEFELNRMLYQPDTSFVIQIAQHQSNIRVMAYFGSWDSISIEIIPAMFKVMQDGRLSEIPVQLIGVDPNLNDGLGYASKYQIQSVSTILIFQGKQELGRITGYPAGPIEEAIYKIVQQTSHETRENESPKKSSVHQDVGNRE